MQEALNTGSHCLAGKSFRYQLPWHLVKVWGKPKPKEYGYRRILVPIN